MKKNKLKDTILLKPIMSSIIIFLICLILRIIEYFFVKTDETVISENFIHKVLGILVLFFILKIINYKFEDIGLRKDNKYQKLLYGILLGLICFSISYFVEYIIILLNKKTPNFEIFVNGFSITGNEVKNTKIIFFILCIIFNIINVIMEEGIFRGLFIKIISNNYSFYKANVISALLFGLWHFVMPLRSYISGEMSLISTIIMMIGYIILSGIMSIKWGLLYKMTGSLWLGLGDHLFNNVLSNILHIVTTTGTDELQIVRIILAQIISFIVVILIYKKMLHFGFKQKEQKGYKTICPNGGEKD